MHTLRCTRPLVVVIHLCRLAVCRIWASWVKVKKKGCEIPCARLMSTWKGHALVVTHSSKHHALEIPNQLSTVLRRSIPSFSPWFKKLRFFTSLVGARWWGVSPTGSVGGGPFDGEWRLLSSFPSPFSRSPLDFGVLLLVCVPFCCFLIINPRGSKSVQFCPPSLVVWNNLVTPQLSKENNIQLRMRLFSRKHLIHFVTIAFCDGQVQLRHSSYGATSRCKHPNATSRTSSEHRGFFQFLEPHIKVVGVFESYFSSICAKKVVSLFHQNVLQTLDYQNITGLENIGSHPPSHQKTTVWSGFCINQQWNSSILVQLKSQKIDSRRERDGCDLNLM